ncbi:hypothetical protein JW935_04145 [candidate division KSB1 bacterium]|nr:hypothetical protein [candidate division KSB1 bacterium]
MRKRIIITCFLIFLALIWSCGRDKTSVRDDQVVARIGDRIITKDEFIKRAEYTIRPEYCKGDYYQHKKIILNSLIAEKLFALEAGDTARIVQNDQILRYIRGRQEQAMRQAYYRDRFYKKIRLKDEKVNQMFNMLGRNYRMGYFTLDDSSAARKVAVALQQPGMSFEDLYEQMAPGDTLPKKNISWNEESGELLREVIFGRELEVGQIIGPVNVEGQYLFMKVLGWRFRPAVSNTDIQNRKDDVVEFLTIKEATRMYQEYVVDLMAGKKLLFDPTGFRDLVNIMGPVYFELRDRKQNFLQKGEVQHRDLMMDTLSTELDRLQNQPLLSLNSEQMTIGDLRLEMQSHPLQYRKKNMRKREFARQLKYAIADLIADRYITQEAYKKGYDKRADVIYQTNMWRDDMLATYYRNMFLQKNGLFDRFGTEYIHIINEHLNPLVDTLQKKYSPEIFINTDLFEKIPLTRTDMFVLYESQPYPVVVPGFPVVTTDNMLDYGQKLEVKGK